MNLNAHITEQELLDQLRKGSMRAFETLYGRHSRALLWKLRRMVKDPQEADELLQDLFVKVWERRAEIEIELSFEAYLHRIAQRMAIDYFRKISRQSIHYERYRLGLTEEVNNTEELLEANETKKLLDQAIARLPEQRRRAFTLCKIEGKSHREAAELMNISPNTVHNHLVKAAAFVKNHLEQSGKTMAPLALLILLNHS